MSLDKSEPVGRRRVGAAELLAGACSPFAGDARVKASGSLWLLLQSSRTVSGKVLLLSAGCSAGLLPLFHIDGVVPSCGLGRWQVWWLRLVGG